MFPLPHLEVAGDDISWGSMRSSQANIKGDNLVSRYIGGVCGEG